ncbi:Piso0_002854 [Millerozyma farinosa CBS 7064]|uniref:Eukaryotic translation initiation factor 2A n=1 Tax=Pichia sorbitophila (strain ATCC MYA-4447 / BCRC 22081 / CBS 7064 / NBRC 10061 / NRRL Y-12695) TaxID=559304 RepID=G8YG56_PICSO|nr:Piso0_002854 [Millerozyma farinosa CBS 7064]
MSDKTQFYCRQPKCIELTQDYEEITTFPKPTGDCRASLYSANGKYFAYTQPSEVVVLKASEDGSEEVRIPTSEVFDLHFSPKGTYLCFWCKPVLLNKESGVWSKNVKVFNISTKKVVSEWSNKIQGGWKPQFTQDEKLFAKNVDNREIHFYDVTNSSNLEEINMSQPKFKYRPTDSKDSFQNFQLSPGLNPSIAIFYPEKSGKPATVVIYNVPNFNQPTSKKNFFKAERCQLKWNSIGTALLALASTDHDTTNKSYYGETNLYLLGIAGSYDSRIDLKKQGPIHDITWSPSAREFAVVYGYMPAETAFFDARGNLIHSLPMSPKNTILYSPHARFVLVAGFGNLQGTVDVYDRQNKFAKVSTFEASNTSVCEWSPCGRFILTATTSPRLRVDNGCKIWHASGKLIYIKEYNELYSVGWRPQGVEEFPPLKGLENAPEPHQSAKEYLEKKKANSSSSESKPSGAYRPPHARNSANNTRTNLYQKELAASLGGSASASGTGRTRTVPGAAPQTAQPAESKSAAKNRKKREAKKQQQGDDVKATPSPSSSSSEVNTTKNSAAAQPPAAKADGASEGGSVLGGIASLEEKKIRSLLKKLRAIEVLKMKQANGEQLEDTQISKIQKEDDIRKELSSLGWTD